MRKSHDDEIAIAFRTLKRFVQAGDDERLRMRLMFQACILMLLEFDSPPAIVGEVITTMRGAGIAVTGEVVTIPDTVQ